MTGYNTPTQINGWMAFPAPPPGTTNGLVNAGHQTLASAVQSRINVAQSMAMPPPPTSLPTPNGLSDQRLFSKPQLLVGDTLLDVATRHSNQSISNRIGEAGTETLTSHSVNERIKRAMEKNARETGNSVTQIKSDLADARVANGVISEKQSLRYKSSGAVNNTLPNNQNVSESPANDDAQPEHTGDTTEENTDAEMSDAEEEMDDAAVSAQQQADHDAFFDPNSLYGEKLLALAVRSSNEDISTHIGNIPGNIPITGRGIYSRVQAALQARSKTTGVTIDQLRPDLAAARLRNGVKPRSPNSKKTQQPSHTTETKNAEPAPQAVVAVNVQGHAEMTDVDSQGSQEGYNADDVEAANALLALASGGAEIQHAAATLMMMHQQDAALPQQQHPPGVTTDEEVSDTEMTMAEQVAFKADHAADYVARWRGLNGER